MAVDFNIKTKSYDDAFIKKIQYNPIKVSENLFERVLKKGNYRIERRINELIEQDPWLKSNITGEENMFSFSQDDYFPVHVETSESRIIYRYCTVGQLVKLRHGINAQQIIR